MVRWLRLDLRCDHHQYAVLMFFGAGAQLTMCCMYHFKFFTVSETVVKIVRIAVNSDSAGHARPTPTTSPNNHTGIKRTKES
jgi:hypothetical protein